MTDELSLDLKFLKLCQYMYGKGTPIIADTDYDAMIKEFKSKGIEVNNFWEDITEEEGIQLMNELSGFVTQPAEKEIVYPPERYITIIEASDEVKREYEEYKIDRNLSIPIVTDNALFSRVYHLFKDAGVTTVFAALKLDGWNVTLYIVDGWIVYAHTRGKVTESTDITSLMKSVLRHVDGKLNIKRGFVIGELYLNSDKLPYLRTKYGKEFRTTRNSVASFIHNKIMEEDLQLVEFGAFRLDIENIFFDSPEQMYEELRVRGFQIPIYEKIDCNLSDMAELVIRWSKDINHLPPSDGIVFQPNSYLIKNSLLQLPEVTGNYETGIYAIKMQAWGEQVYRTVVKDITLTSNTKSKRPSLIVEPVRTRDGRVISVVPVDSVGRLIDEDIYVGKEISVRIVSEKDIRLVYDELKAEYRRMF